MIATRLEPKAGAAASTELKVGTEAAAQDAYADPGRSDRLLRFARAVRTRRHRVVAQQRQLSAEADQLQRLRTAMEDEREQQRERLQQEQAVLDAQRLSIKADGQDHQPIQPVIADCAAPVETLPRQRDRLLCIAQRVRASRLQLQAASSHMQESQDTLAKDQQQLAWSQQVLHQHGQELELARQELESQRQLLQEGHTQGQQQLATETAELQSQRAALAGEQDQMKQAQQELQQQRQQLDQEQQSLDSQWQLLKDFRKDVQQEQQRLGVQEQTAEAKQADKPTSAPENEAPAAPATAPGKGEDEADFYVPDSQTLALCEQLAGRWKQISADNQNEPPPDDTITQLLMSRSKDDDS